VGWHSWLVLVPAVLGLAIARPPRSGARRLATAIVAAIPLVIVLVVAHERTRLLRADQPALSVTAVPERPNLVMIVLDTVRADHLAPYGYARVTTPGLDAFVRRCATVYTEAYSASSWTLPSHASLFTGLYPGEHGAHHPRARTPGNAAPSYTTFAQPLRRDVPTLAGRLTGEGYETAAVVANAGYLRHELGVDRGFAHYDDRWGANLNSVLLLQLAGFQAQLGHFVHRSAESITDLALDWLVAHSAKRPFFLFLNYMEPHFPYLPPPPGDKAFDKPQPLNPYAPHRSLHSLLYDRELLFLDEHLSRLLAGLEALGFLSNTVVIITSDHGEGFGEHGLWQHDRVLYDEVLKVPLYVKGAGPCRSATVQARTTGLDVYHLALVKLGIDAENTRRDAFEVIAEWQGSDQLAGQFNNSPFDVDRDLLAWMEGHVKWIVSSKGTVEAYDLDSDPRELHNLAVDRDQIERAQGQAARWWTAHPPIVTAHHPQELDAETRERMRTLGYVSD
jgi:arylsulfatase A-like enzyme